MQKYTLALLAVFALAAADSAKTTYHDSKHDLHGGGPHHKYDHHGPPPPHQHGSKEMHAAMQAAVEALKARGAPITEEAKREIFEAYCAEHKDEAGCSKQPRKGDRGPHQHGSKEMHVAMPGKEEGRGGGAGDEGAVDLQQGPGKTSKAKGNSAMVDSSSRAGSTEETFVDDEGHDPHHGPHHGPPVGGIIAGVAALAVIGIGFRKYRTRAAAANPGTPLPTHAKTQPLVLAAPGSPGSSSYKPPYSTL